MEYNISQVVLGLAIPFIGTTLGSSFVFLLKNRINPWIEKSLLGFAAGVMIAASVWSLLIPSIEMAESQGKIAWVPAVIGFLLGIITLILVNKFAERIENKNKEKKSKIISKFEVEKALNKELNNEINKTSVKEKIRSTTMLVLAVTLHNIPEGMAVGVVYTGLLQGNAGITIAEAFALALGIAIQNIPEGAIISMPVRASGKTKFKSFLYGATSGIVEPIGAIITLLLTNIVVPILPYLLSFAAGAMIYVVTNELIPESQEGEKNVVATIGVALGFAVMMLLDVALG